jgi:hypothetical protein
MACVTVLSGCLPAGVALGVFCVFGTLDTPKHNTRLSKLQKTWTIVSAFEKELALDRPAS